MQRYLAGRILQAIVSMLVVSMVVFVLARLTLFYKAGGFVIVLEASLSFIGVGIPPPTPFLGGDGG